MPNESLNPLPNVPAVIKVMGGPMGPPGPPNAGVFIKGIANQWPPVADKNAVVGDLYVIPDPVPPLAPGWALPGHGAFWDGKQWLDAGLLRGTKGERGEPGPPLNVKGVAIGWVPSANPQPGDIWQLPEILPAGVPPEFKPGGAAAWDDVGKTWIPLDAVRGPAGHDVEVFGPSPTPPTTGAEKGDIWLSTDCTLFSDTFDPSTITQVPGPPGPQGQTGPSAYDAWKLAVGRPAAPMDDFLAAITGAKGDKGDKGDAGETFKVEGVVATVADLPATPPRLTVYMVQADGSLHIYDPTSAAKETNNYVNLGKISGPSGISAWLSTPVADETKLPATGSAGEMVYVVLTGHLFGWDDVNAKWVDGGKIGGGIDDGVTQGQVLVWDDASKRWSPTNSPLPAAAHDGEVVTWDATSTSWVARQPLLSELQDVDDNSTNLSSSCVLVWDPDVNHWTDSRSIEIDDIEFDASGPGTLLEGIAAYSDVGLDPTKDTWVPSCMAVDKYIREGINLEYLLDCNELKFATNGQVPVWNDTTSQWEPQDPSAASPIIYLGTGAWNAANVTSAADNYGMATDTVPDPATYPPLPGDQYIDLATGMVTAFTGAPGAAPPTKRTAAAITAGASPIDAVPTNLSELGDVTVATPADGQVLTYDGASSQWVNKLSSTKGISQWTSDAHTAGDLVIYEGKLYESTQDIQRDAPPPIADTTKTTGIAVCGTVADGASVKLTIHNVANTERSVTITATASETTPAGLAAALAKAANADAGMSQWATFRAVHSSVYVMGKSEAILVKPTVSMISAAVSLQTTKNNWIFIGADKIDAYTKAEVDAKVAVPAKIVAISAADYNALATKDPNTLYVLT